MVQVTNIAPQATKDQMQTLFGFLGKIEDIRLYPTIRDVSCPVQSRICYIKFIDSTTVGIAQHMTNTVFIDRALIVIPVQSGDIPDEYYALEMTKNGTIVPGLCPQEPKLPPNVVNTVFGVGSEQVIITTDPQLEVNGLCPYPALPANYDSCKIEEIRRTVIVPNIDSSIMMEDLIEFFKSAGEIKYTRYCTRPSDNTTHMLVEFSEQPSVIEALKISGNEIKSRVIKVYHATQAIVKPQAKSNEAAQREIEEAMSRVKEAQSLISAAIDPVIGMLSKDKRSSRRSRSRSRGRRRRSRTRTPSRRSRSRHRKRSTSRSRRSRSRDRRRRSRSRRRSASRPRRSRSRRSRSRRSRSRRSRSRRSRSKSHQSTKSTRRDRRKSRSRDRVKSSRDKERDRSKDKERSKEKERDGEKEKTRESKEKKNDRADSVEKERLSSDKKRSSRSPSRYRSRSRDRRNKRERRRSRSRTSRRRSPSPRKHKRSRSRSRDKEQHKRDKKERRDRKDRSASRSKIPRNYDEEEKGFDSEKERRRNSQDNDNLPEKDSSEKSDNMDISNSP